MAFETYATQISPGLAPGLLRLNGLGSQTIMKLLAAIAAWEAARMLFVLLVAWALEEI